MPATFDSIQTQTLGSAAQEITFTSIPATFTDLFIVFTGASSGSGVSDITLRFNGDTGNNYAFLRILAEASSVTVYSDSNGGTNQINCNQTGTESSVTWINIFDYAGNKWKSVLMKTGAGWSSGPTTSVGNGTWKNTSAITSVTVRNEQQTFDSGSQITLFGIKAA